MLDSSYADFAKHFNRLSSLTTSFSSRWSRKLSSMSAPPHQNPFPPPTARRVAPGGTSQIQDPLPTPPRSDRNQCSSRKSTLPPKFLFRRPDVADARQQLLEILPAALTLESVVIHRKTLHDIFAQPLRGPDAELRATLRFHPVTDRDDDVKIEELNLVGFTVGSSCCIICNNSFPVQFPLVEYVFYVP